MEPWWDFREQSPENISLFNASKVIKQLTKALKNYIDGP